MSDLKRDVLSSRIATNSSNDIKKGMVETSADNLAVEEGNTNRALDVRVTSTDRPPIVITLELINSIIIDYFKDKIQPTILDETGAQRIVPVFYGNPERWATIRKLTDSRDSPPEEKLHPPMIMLRRTEVARHKMTSPVNKYLYTSILSSWSPRNVYDRFAMQNGIRPSRELSSVIVPDYVELTYEVLLWTNTQSQLDNLIEQINAENEEYWGSRNNYKFRIFIERYTSQSELPSESDRLTRSTFNMKVSAYLIPEKIVKNMKLSSSNIKDYTVKKITITEKVVDSFENY